MTRYELLDRIGVGGMAEIFRGKAVAAGGFEKPVAIKRILPHLSQDKRFVELLIAEAKVLSLLKHRNIVQIFDVGLGDDGKYFLVMEYVDGKDLGAVQRGLEAKRRRMPFDLALHIGAEICEALEHAHIARAPDSKQLSLVHRDVSPSNVLLSRAGEVKLTDFGIAKRAEQEATGHGSVRGKFAYISPEQARNEHVDPRSDVFSVGILLWEMIVNRRLFSQLGDLEALRAVREVQVPRPAELDPRLSKEIDAMIMSALARDFKNRPTAGQLGQKLRTLRYSLEVTVGDPATELAKIIDTADEVERASQQMIAPVPRGGFDSEPSEATVFRIRTADAFSGRDVSLARAVIDRFEEEETRQAQLSGDQLRILRSGRHPDSESGEVPPPSLPGVAPARSRRPTDEPTTARPPVPTDEVATIAGQLGIDMPPNQHFDSDENTRLVARSRDRRTPLPQRVARPSTVPPPLPGTIHSRSGPPGLPPPRAPDYPLARPAGPSSTAPATLSPEDLADLPISGAGSSPLASAQTPTPLPPQPSPPLGVPPGLGIPPSPQLPPTPLQRPTLGPPPMPMSPQLPPTRQPPPPTPMRQPPPPSSPPMPMSPQLPPPMPQQPPPMMPTPMQMQPQMPPTPMAQPPMPPNAMPWGQPPPRGQSPSLEPQRPMYPQAPPSQPQQRPSFGANRGAFPDAAPKPLLQPWMLVIGALIMAALAFLITRAFLGGD